MRKILLNIRRHEKEPYITLYNIIKCIMRFNIPTVKIIHLPLYYIIIFCKNFIYKIVEGIWYIPIFRARLNSCGKGLRLYSGFPCIEGDSLIIEVGDNVSFHNNTLSGGKVCDNPTIIIGNNTHLGYESNISCCKKVVIGNNCYISGFVHIMDNNGHCTNHLKRLRREEISEKDVRPVYIGDNSWICTGVIILPGTKIGKNCIISANVVLKNIEIPDNCLVLNNDRNYIIYGDMNEHSIA